MVDYKRERDSENAALRKVEEGEEEESGSRELSSYVQRTSRILFEELI